MKYRITIQLNHLHLITELSHGGDFYVRCVVLDAYVFLKENNIDYSLCGGTAIGAVVHKGFIPWDDDIDICMDRINYNKFIDLFRMQNEYVLDNYRNNDNSRALISKVLDTRTKITYESQYGEILTSSIFVDVSVFDRIQRKGFKQKIQLILADIALISINKYPPENNGKSIKLIGLIYLKVLPSRFIRKICLFLESRISKLSKLKTLPLSEMILNRNGKIIFPNYLFDELVLIDFEDTQFYIFDKYDEYLTIKYSSNYLNLPPESEQHPHHNIKSLFINGKEMD